MIMQIPQHIAMIMDGNGRWAKQKHLPRIAGHKQGVETVRNMVRACDDLGVRFLTLYTFSTENWRRTKIEVNFLMQLLNKQLNKALQELQENNVRLLTIGRQDGLPKKVLEVITRAVDQTKNNTGLTLILALNYGSRTEIVDAALAMCRDVQNGNISSEAVTEEVFNRYLYTADIPDPDLLIRTGGEMRLSNFLLWQLSYSEIYVTEKFWPDFNKQDLKEAIAEFQKRDRRFGGVKKI
ncbi:MAG: isoprenyl transferase [PVC group bacterium]|nr:isoprenyl transferase [PVC group bacterium]